MQQLWHIYNMNREKAFRDALANIRAPRDRRFVVARLCGRSGAESMAAAGFTGSRRVAQELARRSTLRPPVQTALAAGLALIEQTLAVAAGDALDAPPTEKKRR